MVIGCVNSVVVVDGSAGVVCVSGSPKHGSGLFDSVRHIRPKLCYVSFIFLDF